MVKYRRCHFERDVRKDKSYGGLESGLSKSLLHKHIEDPSDRPWNDEVDRVRQDEEDDKTKESNSVALS